MYRLLRYRDCLEKVTRVAKTTAPYSLIIMANTPKIHWNVLLHGGSTSVLKSFSKTIFIFISLLFMCSYGHEGSVSQPR